MKTALRRLEVSRKMWGVSPTGNSKKIQKKLKADTKAEQKNEESKNTNTRNTASQDKVDRIKRTKTVTQRGFVAISLFD